MLFTDQALHSPSWTLTPSHPLKTLSQQHSHTWTTSTLRRPTYPPYPQTQKPRARSSSPNEATRYGHNSSHPHRSNPQTGCALAYGASSLSRLASQSTSTRSSPPPNKKSLSSPPSTSPATARPAPPPTAATPAPSTASSAAKTNPPPPSTPQVRNSPSGSAKGRRRPQNSISAARHSCAPRRTRRSKASQKTS